LYALAKVDTSHRYRIFERENRVIFFAPEGFDLILQEGGFMFNYWYVSAIHIAETLPGGSKVLQAGGGMVWDGCRMGS